MARIKLSKRLILLVAAVFIIGLAVGCGGTPKEEPAETGGTEEPSGEEKELPDLVAAMAGEPQGTDFQQVSTTYDLIHSLLGTPPISLGLQNDQVLPYFAKEVEVSDDGMEIKLTFDPELKFHNGERVTAEAVKRSIDRYLEVSPYAFDYDPVEEFTVEGDTLILRLKEPGPALLVVLGSDYADPVEVGAAEEMGPDVFNRETVSNGAFRIEEWVNGSHALLVRNDEYKDYLPFVDNNGPFNFASIKVRFVTEGFTRVSELRAGNVDLITDVPSELLGQLQADENINVIEYLAPTVRHIQMNTERAPFQDKNVRLAIAYALNRDEIAQGVQGTISPLYGLVSRAMISHDPETEAQLAEQYSHDLQKAKDLLAEAGYEDADGDGILEKDGEPLSFEMAISNSNATDQKAGPIMQSQLKKVGIDMQLREYDGKYIRQLIETSDFDAVLRSWSWLDPGGVWPAGLHTGGRLAPWSHPEVDELMDEAIITADTDERAKNWGKVSVRVWQDVPIIPMWSDKSFIATRSNIKGLKVSVSGSLYFHDLVVEEAE